MRNNGLTNIEGKERGRYNAAYTQSGRRRNNHSKGWREQQSQDASGKSGICRGKRGESRFRNWRKCDREYQGFPDCSQSGDGAENSGKEETGVNTLNNMPIGATVKIVRLHGGGAVKRRMMDMGLTKGTEVFVRKAAPLGDPIELTVRGYELSLRKADAEMIEVE